MVVCLGVIGCDLLDPERPVAHPDTEVFGNLLEVQRDPSGEPKWVARIHVGVPRALSKAEAGEGRQAPPVEKGLVADVTVTGDTVVLADGKPAFIEDIDPGTEVAVIPVAGTTRMMGTTNITVNARYFVDFPSYARWQIPGLVDPADRPPVRSDPDRINSDGVEHAPVPLAGGKVLYFSARLCPPVGPDEPWAGAPRAGFEQPPEGGVAPEYSYRTQLSDGGWQPPERVIFSGVDGAFTVRISWVDETETRCLITVEDADSAWIGSSSRANTNQPWAPVERLSVLDDAHVNDAVYLAGSQRKFVFTARVAANSPGDLWLYDPDAEQSPLPLAPEINSPASEWGSRVGPNNELLFCREDQQFAYTAKTLHRMVVPGPHRRVVTEAAPTGDGAWVFFCLPNYRPLELDQDIFVARWLGEGRLDEPVPVDDWRP